MSVRSEKNIKIYEKKVRTLEFIVKKNNKKVFLFVFVLSSSIWNLIALLWMDNKVAIEFRNKYLISKNIFTWKKFHIGSLFIKKWNTIPAKGFFIYFVKESRWFIFSFYSLLVLYYPTFHVIFNKITRKSLTCILEIFFIELPASTVNNKWNIYS